MSGSLVNPALLLGTLLVAAPIILHLIMRQQPRHMVFPAVRFIRRREDANRRRLRLRHLILLLLRCAAIALLALALARPTISASALLGDQESPIGAALVFDTAPRMQYRHQNLTRIESAREIGMWLLTQFPADSEVAVVDSSAEAPSFAVDPGAAKRQVERLDATPAARPLVDACDAALQLLETCEHERKELYIFTDLSRSSWSAAAASRLRDRARHASGIGIYIVDVGVAEPVDFALGDLRLPGQTLAAGSDLRIETQLEHVGPGGQRDIELYLFEADGKPQKRGQNNYQCRPGESQPVVFQVGGPGLGTHQGFLRIVGEDGLAADDTRYFTLDVRPAWRILIAASNATDPNALILTNMLAPPAFLASGAVRFQCQVVSFRDLPSQALEQYAAVCVVDPTPLDAAVWQQLASYAASGGGVAVILGRNATPIDSFNVAAAQEVLPGRLVRQWQSAEKDFYLAPDSLDHRILSAFKAREGSIPWDETPVFRHWQLGPLGAGAGVIIRYNNNQPALVERPLGKGRVLTMTTPISDPTSGENLWNVLPSDWPVFMLANEMALYLVGSDVDRLNYFVGETAVLRLADRAHAAFVVNTPPGDQIRQTADLKQMELVITSTDWPGNYRAVAGGEQDGVRRGFSVNLPAASCQLERITPEDLKTALGDVPFQLARGREQIDRDISIGRVGYELFPFLIVLMAVVLAAELFTANRFYKHTPLAAERRSMPDAMSAPRDHDEELAKGFVSHNDPAAATPLDLEAAK